MPTLETRSIARGLEIIKQVYIIISFIYKSVLTTNRQSYVRIQHVIVYNHIKYCNVALFSYNGEFVSTMGGVRYMFNLTSI